MLALSKRSAHVTWCIALLEMAMSPVRCNFSNLCRNCPALPYPNMHAQYIIVQAQLTPWICLGLDTWVSVKGQSVAQLRPCRRKLIWGADHCLVDLNLAELLTIMWCCLPPQTLQYSGHIAMCDCAACSTCKSKETLSPSADHCCGQTARHEWRRWSPSADHCCGQTARHEWRAGLPPQITAVVRL